jgi:hypothetical protein
MIDGLEEFDLYRAAFEPLPAENLDYRTRHIGMVADTGHKPPFEAKTGGNIAVMNLVLGFPRRSC